MLYKNIFYVHEFMTTVILTCTILFIIFSKKKKGFFCYLFMSYGHSEHTLIILYPTNQKF